MIAMYMPSSFYCQFPFHYVTISQNSLQLQQSGKEINDKVRLLWKVGHALIQVKQVGTDPFAAIEDNIPWETFAKSITEAESLSQSEDYDYLHLIGDNYSQVQELQRGTCYRLQSILN